MTLTGTPPTGSQPYSISRTYAPLVVTTGTPGQYYIQTNWGNNGAVGCASTSSRTAFLYSIENGGAAQYLLVSVNYLGALNGWEFDTVTGGATITEPATCYGGVPVSCLVTPVAIPGLTISNTVNNGNGTYTITFTWTAISNLKGYYDSAPTTTSSRGSRFATTLPTLPRPPRTFPRRPIRLPRTGSSTGASAAPTPARPPSPSLHPRRTTNTNIWLYLYSLTGKRQPVIPWELPKRISSVPGAPPSARAPLRPAFSRRSTRGRKGRDRCELAYERGDGRGLLPGLLRDERRRHLQPHRFHDHPAQGRQQQLFRDLPGSYGPEERHLLPESPVHGHGQPDVLVDTGHRHDFTSRTRQPGQGRRESKEVASRRFVLIEAGRRAGLFHARARPGFVPKGTPRSGILRRGRI